MRIFSFCIYGTGSKYLLGLLQNINLIYRYFPDFEIFVYFGTSLPVWYLQLLRTCPKVHLTATFVDGWFNMVHRFYGIDDSRVDLMIVRDADSRIYARDRWCIEQFLHSTTRYLHIIRDSIHHGQKIMGGMWAIRKHTGFFCMSIRQKAEDWFFNQQRISIAGTNDQHFLSQVVYPFLVDHSLIHVSCHAIERTAVNIPNHIREDTNDFVGNVIDFKGGSLQTFNTFNLAGHPIKCHNDPADQSIAVSYTQVSSFLNYLASAFLLCHYFTRVRVKHEPDTQWFPFFLSNFSYSDVCSNTATSFVTSLTELQHVLVSSSTKPINIIIASITVSPPDSVKIPTTFEQKQYIRREYLSCVPKLYFHVLEVLAKLPKQFVIVCHTTNVPQNNITDNYSIVCINVPKCHTTKVVYYYLEDILISFECLHTRQILEFFVLCTSKHIYCGQSKQTQTLAWYASILYDIPLTGI